jgi:hypothetical protein
LGDSTSDDFDEDDLSLGGLDSPPPQLHFAGDEDDEEEDDDEEEEENCPSSAAATTTTAYLQPGRGNGGPPAHTCEECLKTFASPGKLRQHEYSHTGETPFECRIQGTLGYYQCCGAGPFLCGSGSSLSKIPAPARTIFHK